MDEKECTAADGMTFGDALGELEEVVRDLEGGKLDLEASIVRYQRGVELLQALRAKLGDAQQKVTTLLGEFEGDGSADADAATE